MYRPPASSPQPDPALGLAGLQTTMSRNESPVSAGSPPSGSGTPRSRPNIPQKKGHIDELIRLKKELEELRQQRDQAFTKQEAMEDDLLKLQEEAEGKDQQLEQASSELLTFKAKADQLSKELADVKETAFRDRVSAFGSPTSPGSSRRQNGELTQARQEIQALTAALANSQSQLMSAQAAAVTLVPRPFDPSSHDEGQRQLREQLAIEQQKVQAKETELKVMTEHYDTKLKAAEAELSATQAQLQAETSLHAGLQKMDIDSKDAEELEHLRSLVTEKETRFSEQLQCTAHFRKISERLTTQLKLAHEQINLLEQGGQGTRPQVGSRPVSQNWPPQQNNPAQQKFPPQQTSPSQQHFSPQQRMRPQQDPPAQYNAPPQQGFQGQYGLSPQHGFQSHQNMNPQQTPTQMPGSFR